MNLFTESSAVDVAKLEQVKRWTRDAWALEEDATVMVTELRCAEPGCPPIETVIAIWPKRGGQVVQYKLTMPIAEVSIVDIAGLRAKQSASADIAGCSCCDES